MNEPKPVLQALKRPMPEAFVVALKERFGKRLSQAEVVREHHGRDESPFLPVPPDAARVNLCEAMIFTGLPTPPLKYGPTGERMMKKR